MLLRLLLSDMALLQQMGRQQPHGEPAREAFAIPLAAQVPPGPAQVPKRLPQEAAAAPQLSFAAAPPVRPAQAMDAVVEAQGHVHHQVLAARGAGG